MNAGTPPDDHPPLNIGRWKLLDDRWLDAVLDTREADLRAHRIALTYSRYAIHLDDIIHGDASVRRMAKQRREITTCNTNWFHYATWGTVTVTRNIAHQRAPQLLDDLLPIALRRRLTPALIRERAADGQRVSRALAWSQRLIFITSAYALKQFHAEMPGDDKTSPFVLSDETKAAIRRQSAYELDGKDDGKRQLVSDEIKVCEATATTERAGRKTPVGEDRHLIPIQNAFRYYQQAAKATDPEARARYILGANVLLTAAEQDLAQRAVATVVNHIPQRLMNGVYRRTAQAAEMWTGVPRQIIGLQLPTRLVELHDLVDTLWSRLMTDQVLVMTLPTETLRLGRDIPPRDTALPFYPAPLRDLGRPLTRTGPESPTTEQTKLQKALRAAADMAPRARIAEQEILQTRLREFAAAMRPALTDDESALQKDLRAIAEMVQSFDRARANGRGSAARDWRVFADRMNWAVALMRSRQQDETLFWPPYSTEDESRIVNGRLPFRAGDPSELEVQAPSDYSLEV